MMEKTVNLLSTTWSNLDSFELRLLLNERVGGPGQYTGLGKYPNTLHLPRAGTSCRISLTFSDKSDKEIVRIERGPAFDATEWKLISEEIGKSILTGPVKVGREYSFSSFRVLGSWRGIRSGVQILPPPDDAPRADIEMAEHPFIFEFPLKACEIWRITNHRRLRDHRNLTLLLNILLAGRTSLQPQRPEHFGAVVAPHNTINWVQQFFFAQPGEVVVDELSPPAAAQLELVDPDEYYTTVGHDGKGLRVPADLDESICCYTVLSPENRAKFDRATYWMDMASRQWNISVSVSFAALVSAVESLTKRGKTHRFNCPTCLLPTQHEVPGATQRFKDFIETYAPGAGLAKQRNDMYDLRSGILHGSELMQIDRGLTFGWDPPGWNERELHSELWSLTRACLRNWLKSPPAD